MEHILHRLFVIVLVSCMMFLLPTIFFMQHQEFIAKAIEEWEER